MNPDDDEPITLTITVEYAYGEDRFCPHLNQEQFVQSESSVPLVLCRDCGGSWYIFQTL